MKKRTLHKSAMGYYFTLFFITVNFLLPLVTNAQTAKQSHGMGAIVLSDAEYAKLPKVNWDTLRKYAPNQAKEPGAMKALSVNGITMLVSPPVGDQGNVGSCVGWAVGYTAMGILRYPATHCWTTARRSPNYVFDHITLSTTNCALGSQTQDGLNFVKNTGVCSWTLMPYVDNVCTATFTAAQNTDAGQNRATSWATLTKTDVTGMRNALDLGYPVVIDFTVYQSFMDMWVSGNPVWTSNTGTLPNNPGHAVTIVGYDNNRQQFKAQNQWGTLNGDHGFFWITYSNIQAGCLRGAYVLYATSPMAPMYINGSANVCTSSAYTVAALPTGSAVVSWSSSNTAVATVSSTGVVTRVSDGSVVLTANINSCAGTLNTSITKNLQVGGNYVLNGTYSTATATKPIQTYNQVPAGSIYAQYTWPGITNITLTHDGSGTWYNGNANNCSFYLTTGQIINLYFTGTSPCGTVTATRTFQQSQYASFAISSSPNPASGKISLAITPKDDTTMVTEISSASTTGHSVNVASQVKKTGKTSVVLYDFNTNAIVKQWMFSETEASHYDLTITGIKSGVYVLTVNRNNVSRATKVIVRQ